MTSPVTVSENRLPEFARELLQTFPNETVFLFFGEMGSGKTTLIQQIARQLEIDDTVSSPTFSIINEYFSKKLHAPVYHFDFYRINNEPEAFDIGTEEYLYSGNLCLVEWPEKIYNLLPENYVEIRIEKIENQPDYRKITVKKR